MFKAKHISGLPYEKINDLLGIGLTSNKTYLSIAAIEHIKEKHCAQFEICLEHIDNVIWKPDYAGQSPNHKDNFVLMKTVGKLIILAAIAIKPDEYGDHTILSSYLLDRNALKARIRKGYLKILNQ